jgi:hypothetical protein
MRSKTLAALLRSHCARFVLNLPVAGALLCLPACGQVSYVGSGQSVNFGSASVGQAGSTMSLNYQIAAGTAVGKIVVLTQGQPGFDFIQGGGTCAVQLYPSVTTCTVTVAFKPLSAGARLGAVVFYGTAGGAPIGSLPIYGTGESGQVAFLPPSQTNLAGFEGSEVGLLNTVADPAGNLFVLTRTGAGNPSEPSGRVIEISPDSPTIQVLYVDNDYSSPPTSLAMDGAGDLYIACWNYIGVPDAANAVVQKWTRQGNGSYTYTGNVGSVTNPNGVATDGNGNVFILDTGHNINGVASAAGAEIVKVSPAGVQTVAITLAPYATSHYWLPKSNMVVDRSGNIYLIDGNNNVREFSQNSGGTYYNVLTLPLATTGTPFSLALDAGGNFYVEVAPSGSMVAGTIDLNEVTRSGQQTVIASYVNAAGGAGPLVDQAGNIFLQTAPSQFGTRSLTKITRSVPTPLNFATPTQGGTVDMIDGPQNVTVQNVGNTRLTIEAVKFPKDFPAAEDADACAGGLSLGVGSDCTLTATFAPITVSGSTSLPLAENLVVATNSLNGLIPPNEDIPLTGTEGKLMATVSLASQEPTATAGTLVRIVATVTGSGAIPTGTIHFTFGSKQGTLPLKNGKTTLDLIDYPAGSYAISGEYSGDSVYSSATSATLTQLIQ